MDTIRKPLSEYGEHIEQTSVSLSQLGERLRRVGVTPAAQLLDAGAGYAQRCADYLKSADFESVLGDLDTLARRQPALVTAAGVIAGFAAARAIKARWRPESEVEPS